MISLDTRDRDPYAPRLLSEYTYPMTFTAHGAIHWSQREDQRLMNSYKRIPREELMTLFPDRTWLAIVSRAYILKIPRTGLHYSPEEDQLLRDLYYGKFLAYQQMVPYFTNRNKRSLEMRMYLLRKRRGGE